MGRKSLILNALLLAYCIKAASAVTAKEDLTVSDEQKLILNEFREKVGPKLYKDYMKEDAYLLRWLRHKEWDIRDAEKALDNNLKWRKDTKIDTIHEEDWSDMVKDYPYTVDGVSKTGEPVGTVSIRDWDIRKAVIQGKMPRLQRYMDKLMDEVSMKVVRFRNEGKNITRWVLLTNVEGFNVVQHACASCTSLWINFLRSYEAHFPDTASAIYAINAPDTFNIILRLIQPSIPKSSRETVKILGSNKSDWGRFLDGVIERNQRHRDYGGDLS